MPPTTSTEGFWGRPTSTIDWCENNYEINFYVAEWCECFFLMAKCFTTFIFVSFSRGSNFLHIQWHLVNARNNLSFEQIIQYQYYLFKGIFMSSHKILYSKNRFSSLSYIG